MLNQNWMKIVFPRSTYFLNKPSEGTTVPSHQTATLFSHWVISENISSLTLNLY